MGIILKFILIILAISWIVRLLIANVTRNIMNSLGGGRQQYQRPKQKRTKKQGDIHIDKKPERDKKIKKDVGEYVDYEEIK